MATYYITGTKKETVGGHNFITHVLIHPTTANQVQAGSIMSKDEVIKLIKAGHSVYTATWHYRLDGWEEQELVGYETRNGREYLRTHPDNTPKDNLLHMLPLANLGL